MSKVGVFVIVRISDNQFITNPHCDPIAYRVTSDEAITLCKVMVKQMKEWIEWIKITANEHNCHPNDVIDLDRGQKRATTLIDKDISNLDYQDDIVYSVIELTEDPTEAKTIYVSNKV